MLPAGDALAACDPTGNVWLCQNTTPGTPETAGAAQATITPTDTFQVNIGTGTDPDTQDTYTNTSQISNNIVDTPGAAIVIINDQHSGTVSMTAGSTLTSTKNDGIRFYNTSTEDGSVVDFDIQGKIYAGSLGYQGDPPVNWWGDGIHVGHPGITNGTTPNVESLINTFTVTVGSESNDEATVQGGDDGIYIGQRISTQATVTNYGTIIGHGVHRGTSNYGVGVNISNVNMNLDNGAGPGFQIDGAATVNNYGVIEGNANTGIMWTSTTGNGVNIAANGAIIVGNGTSGAYDDASITGTTGVYAYGGGSNDITITNQGHIEGTTGSAIQIANGHTGTINNHSLQSVIAVGSGNTAGVDAQNFDQVIFNNTYGLTASLSGNAAYIAHISGDDVSESGNAVAVDNAHGGVIAGFASGLVIQDIFGDSSEGDANDVYVNNAGIYNGGEDDSLWNPGGLIIGLTGDGIDIGDVVSSESGGESGSVVIDNGLTSRTSIALETLDPAVYAWDSESESASGLLSSFADGEDATVAGGIYGYNDGIYGEDIGGDVTLYNQAGIVVGMNGDGVELYRIGRAVDIYNGVSDGEGGLISGHTAGISVSESGPVMVDNQGGTIASDADGGYGITLNYIQGSVGINNAGGMIFPSGDSTTGIYANHVSGGFELDNGSWGVEPGDVSGYGVIIGADGVHLADVDGLMDINNSRGILYGHGTGLIVDSESAGNIDILNSAGSIEGYLHSGIDITGVGTNEVDISNGYDHGGVILGGKDGSGITITGVHSVEITNGFSWWSEDSESVQGGLILGAGTDDHPVIYLSTESGEDGGSSIYNHGIIAASGRNSYLYTPSDNADSESYDPHLPGITLPVELGQTPGDLAPIYGDMGDLATFIASGGASGSIDNLASYALAAADLAIKGRDSAVDITNYSLNEEGLGGIVFGRVDLTGDATEGEDGRSGNVFENYGVWFTIGDNYFAGEGDNAVQNDGFIQTAADSESAESTTFHVADFYNDVPLFTGYLSMLDGVADDSTTVTGNFHGSVSESGASYLAIDAYLDVASGEGGEGSADTLHVNGYATGSTGVIVNVMANSPGGKNLEGIPVVYVGSGVEEGCISGSANLCEEGDTFFVSDKSQNYVNINGIGAVQHGLYAWTIKSADTDHPEYDLVSDWAPAAEQAPELLTGGTNIFYDMSDLVAEHVYGGYFEGSDGGGGADVTGGSTAANAAVWGRMSGSWSSRETIVDSASFGTLTTRFSQSTYTLLGGVDMSPTGDGDGIRIGAYGGYTGSNASFENYAASAKYTGGVIGAYAAYTHGDFYVDGQVDGQFLNMDFNVPLGTGVEAGARATTAGVLANTGYRFYSGRNFIEPIASVSYSNTALGDITSGPATITFEDTQSFRAGLGARVGTTVAATSGMSVEYALLAKVWDEFNGKTSVTVSDGLNTDTYTDDTGGVFGEFSGTATTYTADRSLSGYVSGGAQVKADATTWNAKVGVRKSF